MISLQNWPRGHTTSLQMAKSNVTSLRPSSSSRFPLGETFCHPFSPYSCRWSRAQQVAGHYFRPGFISPFAKAAFPPLRQIYLRPALQSAQAAELPESSYIYGGKGLHTA